MNGIEQILRIIFKNVANSNMINRANKHRLLPNNPIPENAEETEKYNVTFPFHQQATLMVYEIRTSRPGNTVSELN